MKQDNVKMRMRIKALGEKTVNTAIRNMYG